MTRRWSSRVSRPETSSTRWITNITSGRPASYSSKHKAMLFCSAQGSMPSRNSVICLPSLQHDRVLADEIDARDVAVEIDAHQRPVEPRGDLLDMGRFAGAVIAGDHHAAVEGETRENRERRVAVEEIVGIEIRHMLVGRRNRRAPPCPNRCRRSCGRRRGCPEAPERRPRFRFAAMRLSSILRRRPTGRAEPCIIGTSRLATKGRWSPARGGRPPSDPRAFKPACSTGGNYRPE